MSFAPSTRFQSFVSSLRLKIFSFKGRAQALAYATVLGDKTIDWMTAALLERMPLQASPAGVALIASERQLDVAPGEATASIAARATQWIQLGKFVGTPLGILLGLHFSGFDGAVVVQQNGVAYQLQLPLPPIIPGQAWDPTPNQIRTPCSQLAVALTSSVTTSRSIPAGANWWQIGPSQGGAVDTDFCSRYAVLFPGPTLPSYFLTWARATFTGTDLAAVSWNNAFPSSSYSILPGLPTVSSGGGVAVWADGTTQTTTGVTVRASGAFTGTVDLVAFQTGANPFADLHPADLQRMQATLSKWQPRRAICVGVYALVQGNFYGWPVATLGTRPAPAPSSIVRFSGGT